MTSALRLWAWFFIVQTGLSSPISAQQAQPIGTASNIGSVANSNATASSSSTAGSGGSGASGSSRVILLPNGARRSTTSSTVTVCDYNDATGAFPDLVDVCRLR
jgi:hypothetical protein